MNNDSVFPQCIQELPVADIPLGGLSAFLSQGNNHQMLFMEFKEDVVIPAHSHEAQWGIVLEGRIDVTVGGVTTTYTRGDRYYLPAGASHSVKIYAGYADITFFNEKSRYAAK